MLNNHLEYLDYEICNLIEAGRVADVLPRLVGACLAYSNIKSKMGSCGYWKHDGKWNKQRGINLLPENSDLERYFDEVWSIDNTIEKAECFATIAIRLIDCNAILGNAILEEALHVAKTASPYVFENVIDPSLPSRAIATLATMIGEVELSRSISEAQTIPLAFWRAWAYTKIAARYAANEPSLFNELLENALRTAELVEPDCDRSRCLGDIAAVLARTNVSMAIGIANNIRTHSAKAKALAAIAETIAATNRDYASSIFQEALDTAHRIHDHIEFDAKVNTLTFIGACLTRAHILDKQVFNEAYSIALSLPESPDNLRSLAITGLAETMAEYMPDQAEEIAGKIPDSDYRVKARSTLIALTAKNDANKALSLLDSIGENCEITRILPVVVGSLFDQGHELAMTAFAATRFYGPNAVFETVRHMSQFLEFSGGQNLIESIYRWMRIAELYGPKGLADLRIN